MPIIDARDVTKTYPSTTGKRALLGRGGIGSWFRKRTPPRPALAPLSLSIEAGESVGIIGRNGSGKSTLLKLVAGVSAPSAGELAIHGRVASLLELGAGFHPMLTGRENIYLNAGLLGMRHAQVDACLDDIVAFSEIGEFIDQTVDTYSSGMYVRLAFSVAIHTDPDIFLVDEVLSVGDESFQRKCRARILELKAAGKTILFVSHDLGIVNTLCDRVLLLDRGEVISRGAATDTINYYLRQIGAESGIRRLYDGRLEALFNHGGFTLYCDGREVTTPPGVKVQFRSLGAYHESTAAEWRITACSDTALEAEGDLPRLPVRLFVTAEFGERGLVLAVSWDALRPVMVNYIALQCFLPTSYTHWHYGTARGDFPPITPSDRQWTPVALPRSDGQRVDCWAGGATSATVSVVLEEAEGHGRLQIDNTDYRAPARLVHVTEVIPDGADPLPPGRRALARIVVYPGQPRETMAARHEAVYAARQVRVNGLRALMDPGQLELRHGENLLTQFTHGHVQLRIDGLWILSQDLQWDAPREEDGERVATGQSQRFPLALEWRLGAGEGAQAMLAVYADCSAPLRLEEYNVSVALAEAYRHWETPSESGEYPPEAPEQRGWRHLNARYRAGAWVRATGEDAPPMTLAVEYALGAVYPTAIQTGRDQDARLIQLICGPEERGGFPLEPGRHCLFRGTITAGSNS